MIVQVRLLQKHFHRLCMLLYVKLREINVGIRLMLTGEGLAPISRIEYIHTVKITQLVQLRACL